MTWHLRPATDDNIPALRVLMQRAIGALMDGYLSPEEVAASHELMGLDTQLIADGTYLVAVEDGAVIGSGGWSRRATLFGADHTAGRDARLLDPATEAARIRAMYTDPDHVRRGIGRAVLDRCEAEERAEGFQRAEMGATLAGQPLYEACGYAVLERFSGETSAGVAVPLLRMGKALI